MTARPAKRREAGLNCRPGIGKMRPMTDDHPAPDDAKKALARASSDASALEAKVKELTEQVAKLTDIAARAQADLQNAKGRMEREREDIGKYALESFILRLLPTVDNFQRAMQHLPPALKDDEWAKGVLAMEQELLRILADVGLTRMDSLGKPLDPHRHEPLMEGPGKRGTVAEVFEEGYELNGRVLRPAKVRAGNGEEAPRNEK